MYEYIKGSLSHLSHTTAVVEAMGVGYLLNITLTTYATLEGKADAKLYTHMYMVQDSAPVLYGFATTAERELFRLLISVSGIGAGTARIMLSSNSPSEIASMIATGNVPMLTKVKGVGPKTAQLVVLKLRDKVLTVVASDQNDTQEWGSAVAVGQIERWSEALDALLVLGFSKAATEKTVRRIASENPAAPTEELIRRALSEL